MLYWLRFKDDLHKIAAKRLAGEFFCLSCYTKAQKFFRKG